MAARVIRILGALSVEIDGTALAIASATQRRLLAVLLAQPDVVVSVDRLADAVWDGNPPASARASLQTYLYRLRTAIGDEVIVTRPPGYLLDSSTFVSDIGQFERLVGEARSGDPLHCVVRSEQALALWRGNAYAEFDQNFACRPAAVRLQEMRLGLMERRIEALLNSGSLDQAVVESETLCAAEPLRELAHAQFMKALAAQGRMPEALRVFDGFRRYLAEETGLAPSSALQTLAQELIAQTNRDVEALERQDAQPRDQWSTPLTSVTSRTQPASLTVPATNETPGLSQSQTARSQRERSQTALSQHAEPSTASNENAETLLGAVMAVRIVPPSTAIEFSNNEVRNAVTESSLSLELARRADDLLREVVRNAGGEMQTGTGDVVNCWFRTASDAVLAAVEVQQTLGKDHHRHGDASVGQAKIGIGFGAFEVKRTGRSSWPIETTVAGDAVQVATSLAENAAVGSIVVSAHITSAMPPTAGIVFVATQTKQSKSETAAPFAVDWGQFPDLANRLGLPSRLMPRPGGLVGRETMMEPLLNCLDQVEQRESSLVSLIGAPGIGKTSLVAAFAEQAVARGCAVLFGSCRRDPNLPYQAISAALHDLVRRHPAGPRIFGPYRNDLAPLIAGLDGIGETEAAASQNDADLVSGARENFAGGLADADPQSRRTQTFDAITQVLCSLSNQLPIVFIVDDLHWADAATVELLEELLVGIRGHRILVLVALREYESVANTRLAQLYQSVAAIIPSRRISVQGISVDAVASFVRQVHGPAGSGMAESIHQRTGGNPFLVGELLASTSSQATRSDGKGDALSARIVDALAGRLSNVGEACRKLLSVAAVAGSEFDPVVVAGAVDTPQDQVFDLFDEAVASGNLRERAGEELRLGFDHELLRESLLAGMTQLRRTRYHRDLGLSIERRHQTVRPIDLPDLARHFSEAATLGETGRACTYNTLAAERSLVANGDVQAISYFRSALEFSDEEVARAEIMVGLGEALRRRGDRSYRGVLGDAASIADGNDAVSLMARAVLTDYRGTFGIAFEVDEPRVKRLRRTIDRVGEMAPTTRARLLAALSVELVWSDAWQESLLLSDDALSLARSELLRDDSARDNASELSETESVLAEVLQLRQWVAFHPLQQRLAETVELDELTARSSEPVARFESAAHASFTYLRAADPIRLAESLELARWLARRIDRPVTEWMLALRESAPAMLACRFREAEALIARSFELGTQTAQPDAFLQRSVQTFWLEFESVDVETQRSDMRKLAMYAEKMPLLSWPSLAFRFADLSMLKESESLFLKIQAATSEFPGDQLWLWNTCQMASLAIRFAPQLREKYLAALVRHCGQIANTVFGSVGAVDRYVGQLRASLGDAAGAEADFAQAIAIAEKMSAPSWKARAELDLADFLDTQGRTGDAAALRSRAEEAADRFGLPVVRDRSRL
jgi:DNA-binding SARP family transcriptional activator